MCIRDREHKRDAGSPTSKLLEILGITTQDHLSSRDRAGGPELRRLDISSIINIDLNCSLMGYEVITQTWLFRKGDTPYEPPFHLVLSSRQ